MKSPRTVVGAAALVAVIALSLVLNKPVRATNHQNSSTVLAHVGTDVTDVYMFPNPANPTDVVLVMNVMPNSTPTTVFDNKVLYQMKFDNQISGEAVGTAPVEDLVIQFAFTAPVAATAGVVAQPQTVNVYGPQAPNQTGPGNTLGTFVGSGALNAVFQTYNGMTIFAGPRSDPAFFDRTAFYNIIPDRNQGSAAASCLPSGTDTCPQGFNPLGTATNYFNGRDVMSIVVDVPRSLILGTSGPKVAFWATTNTQSGM